MPQETLQQNGRPKVPDSGASPGAQSLALAPGTRFGPYEIRSLLGAGGMGEVYRARDTRLGREVAIKVLPSDLSSSQRSLDRLEREARSASALNHPNIVTIYELGQVDSAHYIAMELVDGKTLRQVLDSGGLTIAQAIHIAVQVADGLAKAHEAGIVHRDLKPENLIISRDGLVKILDFGLAKATGEVLLGAKAAEEPEPDTPTQDDPQSLPGTILGTVGYMSPEQASGRPLDFRSDQFSFGLVLYEMATGKRAYQRNTLIETLVAILREEPEPISLANPEAPVPLCWAVERCLAKDPGRRYASTRDLVRDLAALRDGLSGPMPRRVEVRPSNLPPQRTTLVGREKEVAAAKELLLRDAVRLVTVTGPAGIGKTRLMLQTAAELGVQFPGGVHLVSLAAVSDPSLIPSVIAQAMAVRESGGQTALEALRQHLRGLESAAVLLLLDNFEHLLEGAPVLAELLAANPGLKLLVSSRAALHVYGEHEFPVPPLGAPRPGSLPPLDALIQYPAVALLVQRASAVKPGFGLTPENAAAIVEICARLDGLPLAIELAAARLKFLSPSAVQTRLASRLQLLTGGPRDRPVRQQTLRGAIDWSYELLGPAEQTLFRRLSVFAGGCTLEGAEAVCNTKGDLQLDVFDGIASLVDKSLVRQLDQTGEESRFVMLETIREYGLEKLKASGEEGLVRRAHAAYFLVLAEEGVSRTSEAERAQWQNRLETEHGNVRTALDWLAQSGDAEWGLRLGAALFRFWETGEHLTEGREALRKILALPGAASPTKARARVAFAAGVLAAEQRDYVASDAFHGESLEISRELGDKYGVAVALNAMAVTNGERGNVRASRLLFEESLRLWRELGNPLDVARALSNLANVVKLDGGYAEAHALYDECLEIFRELGDHTGAAWTLNHQGDVARERGDTAAARSLYEESLAAFRALEDQWGIASSLADLGYLACNQGDFHGAHTRYRESLKIFERLEHKRGVARLLEGFAGLAALQSQPDRALALAGAAAALRQALGAPLTPAEQRKLEASLKPARDALANSAGGNAWLEGWAMPLEQAVEEALKPDPSCPRCRESAV